MKLISRLWYKKYNDDNLKKNNKKLKELDPRSPRKKRTPNLKLSN